MNRGDRWLLLIPLLLTAIGIIMVFSSSAILGITRYQDPNHFFIRQLGRALLGIGVMVGCAFLPMRWLQRGAPWVMALAGFFLVAVIIVGRASHGAVRWLPIGPFSVQPSDLGRLAAVGFMAWWLARRPPSDLGFLKGMVVPLAILGGLSGLILLQPNLSSAALLGMVGLGMLFFAGARVRHLAIPIAVGVLVAVAAVSTHPYMMKRVNTYVDFVFTGRLDTQGSGWQLDQSLIAIGSGGLLGRGLGAGHQKYLFLPEAHTDFIYSILAEEVGFLGTTILIVLFVLLIWRGLRVAARAHDPFSGLLAAGLTLQIGLYALVNLGVAMGWVPTTGLPLPFVSYGGSALLANLAAAGILYAVSVENAMSDDLARRRWAREGP